MYNFIVLGQIPGTNIRISFAAWMGLAALILLSSLAVKRYLSRNQLMGLAVKQRFSQVYQTVVVTLPPRPLHASQLHQRLRPTAR